MPTSRICDPPFTLNFTDVSFGSTLAVPEPSSLPLLLAAGAGLLALRWRHRRSVA
jgi:hypothetical protein